MRTYEYQGKQPNDICLGRSSSPSCVHVYTSFHRVRRENAQGRTPYNTEDSGTLERDGAMATTDSTGRGERRLINL